MRRIFSQTETNKREEDLLLQPGILTLKSRAIGSHYPGTERCLQSLPMTAYRTLRVTAVARQLGRIEVYRVTYTTPIGAALSDVANHRVNCPVAAF
jgi:hypothetical protein